MMIISSAPSLQSLCSLTYFFLAPALISVEPVKGQKIEEYVVTDLDLLYSTL